MSNGRQWMQAQPGLVLLAALLLAGLLSACLAARTPEPTAIPPSPQPTSTAVVVVGIVQAVGPAAATATVPARPVEVLLGQHLSASGSYTETETEAAGPMLCRIERNSCAFSRLVSNHDLNLLFSEGEAAPYGAEDRLMHPAMVLPLARLAELVVEEWGDGVQVMITEAYDSLLDHHTFQPNRDLRYSLHFEGRSADLIIWPPDPSRMGRLCALALEAGFAWVHNEGDHCHASIRADSLCSICSGSAGQ